MVTKINGSKVIEQGNEEDLQYAVATVGPIAVAVDASSTAFRVSSSATTRCKLCLLN